MLDTDEHIAVKVAYVIYQKDHRRLRRPQPTYRETRDEQTDRLDPPWRARGTGGVPAGLEEISQLGRTLWRRRHDILAFFDHHTSNGPTEAIKDD